MKNCVVHQVDCVGNGARPAWKAAMRPAAKSRNTPGDERGECGAVAGMNVCELAPRRSRGSGRGMAHGRDDRAHEKDLKGPFTDRKRDISDGGGHLRGWRIVRP